MMDNYPFLDRSFIQERQRLKRAEEERERQIHQDQVLGYLRITGIILGSVLTVLVMPVAFVLAMIYAPIVAVVSVGAMSIWLGYTIGKRGGRVSKQHYAEMELGRNLEGLSRSYFNQADHKMPEKEGEDRQVNFGEVIHIYQRRRSNSKSKSKVEKSIEGIRNSNKLGY